MSIQWKKSIICILTGIIAIFFILMWLMFNNVSLNNLKDMLSYEIPQNVIEEGLYGYKKIDNCLVAEVDDAGINIAIPFKRTVQAVHISAVAKTTLKSKVQIYYTGGKDFAGDRYVESELQNGYNDFEINKECSKIRIDLTSLEGEIVQLKGICIIFANKERQEFFILYACVVILYILVTFIYFNRNLAFMILKRHKKLLYIYETISQIVSLAFSDFRARFSGSYLGVFWGVIQPLSTILLFWFVFQVGFRSNPVDDVPFILWLSAGMIPWNYFYDAWLGETSSFTAYGYIVKKVVFRVEMLPMVKALSSAIMNGIFNMILLVIYSLYGEFPGLHVFDMAYYSFCIFAISRGLALYTSTLNVFMKDMGHFLGIVLQFLMWMTPMMWDYHMIPEKYSWFYKLNPLHYVINGYRESLINGYWFFEHYKLMIYFWSVSIILLFSGYVLMKRLKPHFADVL